MFATANTVVTKRIKHKPIMYFPLNLAHVSNKDYYIWFCWTWLIFRWYCYCNFFLKSLEKTLYHKPFEDKEEDEDEKGQGNEKWKSNPKIDDLKRILVCIKTLNSHPPTLIHCICMCLFTQTKISKAFNFFYYKPKRREDWVCVCTKPRLFVLK